MIEKGVSLCTICARGGSKGVRNKNVRPLAGKPMLAHSIGQALQSGLFDHVVVSTDSEELAEAAKAAGAELWFRRPAELASDTAAKLPVIRHAFLESERHYGREFPYLVDLDATSPLRIPGDITAAFECFLAGGFDNLVTAMPARRSPYFNLVEQDAGGRVRLSKKLETPVVRRQDAPRCFDMNASIYIWKRRALLEGDKVLGENTGLYVMPEERSIDVDSELDFKIVELLMAERPRGG